MKETHPWCTKYCTKAGDIVKHDQAQEVIVLDGHHRLICIPSRERTCRLKGDMGKLPGQFLLPKTNSSTLNIGRAPKETIVYSNHPCSGAKMFASGRVSHYLHRMVVAIPEVNWIPNYVSWVSLCILQGMTIAPWHEKREALVPGDTRFGNRGCFRMCWWNSGGGAWKLGIYSSWDWNCRNWTVRNQGTLNVITNR